MFQDEHVPVTAFVLEYRRREVLRALEMRVMQLGKPLSAALVEAVAALAPPWYFSSRVKGIFSEADWSTLLDAVEARKRLATHPYNRLCQLEQQLSIEFENP